MSDKLVIDWSAHDKYERATITCECGTVYLSHCKHVNHEGRFVGVTQTPCPSCGKDVGHIRRAEHPPERWTIGG